MNFGMITGNNYQFSVGISGGGVKGHIYLSYPRPHVLLELILVETNSDNKDQRHREVPAHLQP